MRPLDPRLLGDWLRRTSAAKRKRAEDRRRTPLPDRRIERRFPIANTGIRNHVVNGSVLDLSRDGLAIESTTALRPGQRYTFTLTIGEHLETLRARVLWCRLQTTERLPNGDVRPLYRAGIERVRPTATGCADREPLERG